MTRFFFIFYLFFAHGFFAFSQKPLDWSNEKVIADAVAVHNALYSLSVSDSPHSVTFYMDELKDKFDALSRFNSNFKLNYNPFQLTVTDTNKKEIEKTIMQLKQLTTEIRMSAKRQRISFQVKHFPLLRALLSENPGDYYTSIQPKNRYFLHNHPLRGAQEELQFQDIPFATELAAYDTSLWNFTTYCPNLKSLVMFASGVNDSILNALHLNEAYQLNCVDLSENQLAELPDNFNEKNTLVYLSLAKNRLATMPDNLSEWNQIRYMNLRGNQFDEEEKKRIKEALPFAQIDF